jgi:hypothetical protein
MLNIKAYIKKYIILVFLIPLLSCGGGGGGGSSVPFYGGLWRGTVEVTRDTCSAVGQGGITASARFTHNINQTDRDIVIDTGTATFTGGIDSESDTIFSASRMTSDANCTSDSQITYLISRTDSNIANIVSISVTQVCGSRTCILSYAGTGRRF